VIFPDVLRRLAENIQWTTDLGNAFVAQQTGVMDAVQRMRAQAMASGNLTSNAQQVVTTEGYGPSSVVEIEPATPQLIYVPIYDPYTIWGPPAFYPYPVLIPVRTSYFLSSGRIYWPSGIFVGNYFSGWNGWGGWGWSPNWYGRTIVVNNTFFNRYGYRQFPVATATYRGRPATIWRHDPTYLSRPAYVDHRVSVPGAVRPVQRYDNSRIPSVNRQPQAVVRPSPVSPAPIPGGVSRPGGDATRFTRTVPSQVAPVAPRSNNFSRGPNPNPYRGEVRPAMPPAQNFHGPVNNAPRPAPQQFRGEGPRTNGNSGSSHGEARAAGGGHRGR
jgi:hypothetical protein